MEKLFQLVSGRAAVTVHYCHNFAGMKTNCLRESRSIFFQSSCRIRVNQLSYASKPTEIRWQYGWRAENIWTGSSLSFWEPSLVQSVTYILGKFCFQVNTCLLFPWLKKRYCFRRYDERSRNYQSCYCSDCQHLPSLFSLADARLNFFSPPVVLLSFNSRFALVRRQINSNTTGSQKIILTVD